MCFIIYLDFCIFFFFKQKTAYEMRISDWSSDVCSSDLFGFAIIEDDYDHEFHFQSQPLLPLASYGPGQVLYVGSLSKLLLPALRIGYVVAPPAVVDAVAHRVSLPDGMGNRLSEEAAGDLFRN